MLYKRRHDNEENTLLNYKSKWFWQVMLIKPFSNLLLLCSGCVGRTNEGSTKRLLAFDFHPGSIGLCYWRLQARLRGKMIQQDQFYMWFALSFPGKSSTFLELIFRLIIYLVPVTRTPSSLFSGLYLALREKWLRDSPQHILLSILGASQRWKERQDCAVHWTSWFLMGYCVFCLFHLPKHELWFSCISPDPNVSDHPYGNVQ